MKLHAPFAIVFSVLALVALTVTTIGWPSLRNQQTNQIKPTDLSHEDLAGITIDFARSGCYGDCPAYKLTIHGDGRVEYDGENNVKNKGKKTGLLDVAAVREIIAEFDAAKFLSIGQYSLKECSCTVCTDMPTVTTGITTKSTVHSVEHYYGCTCAPKALRLLEAKIDKIAKTEQWTGDVSKSGPF